MLGIEQEGTINFEDGLFNKTAAGGIFPPLSNNPYGKVILEQSRIVTNKNSKNRFIFSTDTKEEFGIKEKDIPALNRKE